MTQEVINVGTSSNDGTGDTIRVSFRKTNNNFTELYSSVGNATANLVTLDTKVETYNGDLLQLGGTAFDVANDAYDLANNLINISIAASDRSNNASDTAIGSAVNASAAFNYANGLVGATATARAHANAAYLIANSAFARANIIYTTNQDLFDLSEIVLEHVFPRSNDAYDLSLQVYQHSLDVAINAASGYARTNAIYGYHNTAISRTNALFTLANSNYVVTNSNYSMTNTTFNLTQRSYNTANAAFGAANSKINTANGTATGTFTVTGITRVVGDTNTFEIIDGIIFINGEPWNPTPVGTVIYSARPTAPDGYLLCDGSAVSRTTYYNLYSAIGIIHGAGNGTTTFNVPDLRGVFIRGLDSSRGIDAARALGSYQDDLFKSHTHTDAGHRHNILNTGNNANGGGAGWLVNPQIDTGLQTLTGYANIQSSGGPETRPKNVALLPCIKY